MQLSTDDIRNCNKKEVRCFLRAEFNHSISLKNNVSTFINLPGSRVEHMHHVFCVCSLANQDIIRKVQK